MTASQTPRRLQPLRRQKLGTNIHRSIRITCRLDTPYKMYKRRQIGSPAQARGRVNFSFLSFSSEDGSSERNIINKTTKAEIPLVIFHEYPESKPEKKESMHPSLPPNPGASQSP